MKSNISAVSLASIKAAAMLSALSLLATAAAAEDSWVTTNAVVLKKKWTFSPPIDIEKWTLGSPISTVYTVPLTSLPCHVTWRAGSEPFPLNLHAEAVRAKSIMVSNHVSDQLTLSDIEITRMPFTGTGTAAHLTIAAESLAGKAMVGVSSNWWVGLQFEGYSKGTAGAPPNHRSWEALMLLDGTYASEKHEQVETQSAAAAKGRGAARSNSVAGSGGATTMRLTGPEVDRNTLLNQPDFRPCSLQWNPLQQELPIDLSAQAIRARDYLWRRMEGPGRPGLRSIGFSRFCAEGQCNHWLVSFSFDSDDHHFRYHEYMLLDGRILGVEQSPSIHPKDP